MKENIIGRDDEKRLLDRIYQSAKSEFVAVCGRRRVGKTFLVREFFEKEMVFHTSGMAHEKTARQIKSFLDGYAPLWLRLSPGAFLELMGIGTPRHRAHRVRLCHIVDDGQAYQQPRRTAQPADAPDTA